MRSSQDRRTFQTFERSPKAWRAQSLVWKVIKPLKLIQNSEIHPKLWDLIQSCWEPIQSCGSSFKAVGAHPKLGELSQRSERLSEPLKLIQNSENLSKAMELIQSCGSSSKAVGAYPKLWELIQSWGGSSKAWRAYLKIWEVIQTSEAHPKLWELMQSFESSSMTVEFIQSCESHLKLWKLIQSSSNAIRVHKLRELIQCSQRSYRAVLWHQK